MTIQKHYAKVLFKLKTVRYWREFWGNSEADIDRQIAEDAEYYSALSYEVEQRYEVNQEVAA